MRLIKKKEIVNPGIKIDFFSVIFSSGLYSGFVPAASGTFGSLIAAFFFLIPGFINTVILIPVIVICFFIGIYTSNKMVKRYGDDPSVVVIDEFVGMWITVLIASYFSFGFLQVTVGFAAFRVFDILKVYPASYFDKMKNGFGIMMDDVVAGVYAGITTSLILILIKNYL
jgi:phosphatidylglycerophosphatase A